VTASRKSHIGLIAAFLILIGVVAPSQIVWELRDGQSPQIVELFRQRPTRTGLRQFESRLESDCRLAQAVRPWMQYARFILFEDAGDKAPAGRHSWIINKHGVKNVTGRYSPPETQSKKKN